MMRRSAVKSGSRMVPDSVKLHPAYAAPPTRCGSEQLECPAIRQTVTMEVVLIDRHDFRNAGFHRQPAQGDVRQVHLAFSGFRVALHPANLVAQMKRFEGINLDSAQFDPTK